MKQPNLIYIFADQMRIQALGIWKEQGYRDAIHGETDPVHTPALDKLAKEGALLSQVTSTHPVCSPHRAMLMSGMYPSQNGVENGNCYMDRPQGLHNDITCFTDVLSESGYETAYVGKTHWERTEPLFDENANYVGQRTEPGGHYANGFDTYIPPGRGRHGNKYWFQHIRDRHHDACAYSNRPELVGGNQDGDVYYTREFTPKCEANIIIDYLKNENGQREAGKPFSVIWSPNPPHSPYAKESDCEADILDTYYRDMPDAELMYRPNIDADGVVSSGASKNHPKVCTPIYYSLVTGLDRQVGRVLDALEEIGEADNTIVVFTADHGDMMGSQALMGKNQIYQESFLVPFMIRYPGVIHSRIDDLLLGTVDIMPTLLSMMGLKDNIPDTAIGMDYAQGIATGDYSQQPKPGAALYLNANKNGVRTNRYTYQVSENSDTELYDNAADPYQMNNLALDAIDAEDLTFMQQELGRYLALAQDEWAKEKKCSELIQYPE